MGGTAQSVPLFYICVMRCKMEDKEKLSESENTNKKIQKPKSFLETVREIDAADRKAELEEESRIAEERARREEKQRKAYEDKLRQERIELMKLKQGVISEEDIETAPREVRTYTVREKIGNFFYHNKVFIILGAMILALVIFLVYDFIRKERPDIQSMYIAADFDMSYYSGELTELWSKYCPDYNGDGEPLARLYYVPTGYADDTMASLYFAQSDRTKLIGEFQSGTVVMIIGDKDAYQSIDALEDVFVDCRELFPDDPYAEELGYRLAGTDFMDMLGAETVDDTDLYVSFRIPGDTMGMKKEKMQVNFDHAVEFWKNFLAEHRIDGLDLPPTPDVQPLPISEDNYDYMEKADTASTEASQ